MQRWTAILFTCFILLIMTACVEESPPPIPVEPELPPEESPIPSPPTLEELQKQQIEEILNQLSTEELVGQLFFSRCPAENQTEDIQTYHLGGYLLFGRDYKNSNGDWLTMNQFQEKLQHYQEAAAVDTGIPLLIGTDEEGGTVIRASRNPNLFSKPARSPQQIEVEAHEHGDCFAEDAWEKNGQLRSIGINVNLAPIADISTNSSDFIYDRTIGKDAAGTADYVRRVVESMADVRIGSVLKHFPGYGNNVDTHTGIALDKRPLEQFRTSDFLPFKAGIAAGGKTTAVLVSHNIIENVDNHFPASLSPAVHQLLREELGFNGVIMTDDLAMEALAAYAKDGNAAVTALQAGNDLILTTDYRTQIPKVLDAIKNGTLEKASLQKACRRVLEWKQAIGLLPPIHLDN